MKELLKTQLMDTGVFEDNLYLDKYIELIMSNKNRLKEKFKTQQHHIIPKCYYKIKELMVDERDDNKVYLLHKDHVLAHYFICLCSSEKTFRYYNILAVIKLLNFRDFKIDDDYEQQLQFLTLLDKYQDIMEEKTRIDSERFKGVKRDPELVAQISEKLKQIPHTDEWNLKVSEALKGKEISENQRVLIGVANKGRIVINKNGKIKRVKDCDLAKYIEDGWTIGGIPHNNIWNKGLTKDTDERVKAAAEKKTGRKWTEEQRARRSKDGNPMYGKHKTQESIDKGIETRKSNNNNNPSDETKRKISNTLKGYIVVYNADNVCRHIRPEQLEEFEKQGYYRKSLSKNNNIKESEK